MITPSLEQVLNKSFDVANSYSHEFVTLEHLLYCLFDDPDAVVALKACEADIDVIRDELEYFFEKELPKSNVKDNAEPTVAFNRTIQRAVIHAQGSSNNEITGADVLIHMFSEPESFAIYLLEKNEISKLDLLNYISHGIAKDDSVIDLIEEEFEELDHGEETETNSKNSALENYAQDLNVRAADGKIDPVIGRQLEIERLMQILCRRKKNNPILVGEAGVGKTAIAEGLAIQIEEGKVPDLLKEARIFSLDLGALLAGTKFRGDFEARLKSLLSEIKAIPDAILFIDEIHTLIGAGATEGAMDASNMLKPLLSNGDLRCIGSTTYQEYRNIFNKNAALNRRFQKVDVPEPNAADCVLILEGLKSKFEAHHEVKYATSALKAAVDLGKKYLHDRFLPDKAIDLLDEAGSANRLLTKSKRKSTITEKDIENLVSKQAQIPTKTVTVSRKERLKNLERDLKILIFGQDEAIVKVCNSIKLSQSGLTTGEKPIGNFLFMGPTGVGKTELAKQLAQSMGIKFLRFDMSEYMEKHSVARLIGAPPGYVGYDQGGLLTDAINKTPYAVVLLDEIEKAHPDVYNILLQVFDYGFLTDNNGKKSDFRNAIIIMTSNVGAAESSQSAIGFDPKADTGKYSAAIKRAFSPEFINRLDAMVQFKSLAKQQILSVVGKFLIELENLLEAKNVTISFEQELCDWIAEKGYDVKNGARPIQRLIDDQIKKPLVDELLFGALEKGGHINISIQDSKPKFEFKAREIKKKASKPRQKKATKSASKNK